MHALLLLNDYRCKQADAQACACYATCADSHRITMVSDDMHTGEKELFVQSRLQPLRCIVANKQ